MKLLHILVLSGFLPLAAAAQDAAAPVFGPVDAAEVTLEQFLWLKRPIVVFADTPDDPAFQRQMQRITADLAPLEERDVVIITDTDPAARTEVRQRLRPRGFSLVLMDKDGEVKRRNPAPWGVREITHAIDRFPLRRQEMLERRPAGR
ncbi:MAG: DUF4174 domain-containing protein [Rhodobacter sp.]|jgi:hypothetical protein|nr:DUF4174 domain-containing protein [Rhodobacter sp.]MCA3513202.1 DUF4174 domain-containing protein [Rhodobacter sp.]MCA3519855.1 DUF4174 domain-containing protein [Rhodobacter sp.]MCA3521969.1 DUF4174 domain-containing protein [Rhodobacter sp.]MCA3525035.1 DUF4174 domain-containing protein [Rhodobacter sp.]